MLDVNLLNHLTLYLVKGPGIYHMLDVNALITGRCFVLLISMGWGGG